MAKTVIIVGETGTGKSSSLRNLKPSETYIIKVIDKELPFKEEKEYSKEKKNLAITANESDIVNILTSIASSRPDIKNIIIDDIGFVMTKEFFDRSNEIGYAKFTDIAKHMQEIIETCENLKGNINIALMFHAENIISDGVIVEKGLKTIGKLLDQAYDPRATVSTVLYTDVAVNKEDISYNFITNRTVIKGTTIPAKSPIGMFDRRIPNDLKFVFDKINEYYR